jgi:hypothetical protein
MRAYFDSSALVKRYVEESGSDAVQEILDRTDELAIGIIGPPEGISVFVRKRRERILTPDHYQVAKSALIEEIADMTVCGITSSVVETIPLRTLDALHVACAADWNADVFVSADKRQMEAARNLGLQVIGV